MRIANTLILTILIAAPAYAQPIDLSGLPGLGSMPPHLARFHQGQLKDRIVTREEVKENAALARQIDLLNSPANNPTPEQMLVVADFPLLEVTTDLLSEMFPGQRFYILAYHLKPAPEMKGKLAIASGLYQVLMVNQHGQSVAFSGYGNYDDFGDLLASHKIKLTNQEQADRITTAYYHMYRSGWPSTPAIQDSPTQWRLAPEVRNGVEYYFGVTTDSKNVIQSGQLHARQVDEEVDE